MAGHAAAGGAHEAAAIEDQLIVAAHLVHVDHRAAQAIGGGGGQLAPQLGLALGKGGGGEVEQQIGPQGLQLADRVGPQQPLSQQPLLHPEVLAEGEPQAPAPPAPLQLQQAGLVGGAEIAPLVEDVVTGQQPLAGHHPPPLRFHQGRGVEQIGLLAIAGGFTHPQQQGQPGRQLGRQLIEGLVLALPQRRPQQQIPGWVAPQRQLRRHHQLGPLAGRRLAGLQQLLAVAQQVAHQRIDLGEGDAHQRAGGELGCPRP